MEKYSKKKLALIFLSFLQEYFVSRVGSEIFRSQFADWAGHNCANLDYITREQVNQNISDDDVNVLTFVHRSAVLVVTGSLLQPPISSLSLESLRF